MKTLKKGAPRLDRVVCMFILFFVFLFVVAFCFVFFLLLLVLRCGSWLELKVLRQWSVALNCLFPLLSLVVQGTDVECC